MARHLLAGSHLSGVFGIRRFKRPVVFQETPDYALPALVQDANPLGIPRCIDGTWTKAPLTRAEG
jgi:NADP-dependent aldehyde dehydrogenase